MDPEIKRLLEETQALTKENHRLLKAMRRDQWVGFWLKLALWIIVLVLPLFFYQQFIAPIVSGGASSVDIQKLINSYQAGQ